MDTRNTTDFQSMVDTHEEPFVIIDRDFRIVAVNQAYEQAYGSTRDKMVGQHCYQISHQNDKPCYELGEDCPHQQIRQTGKSCSCLHIHYDGEGRPHNVCINAYPIPDSSGELFLGEAIKDMSTPVEQRDDHLRMVGESPAFVRLRKQLKLAASSDAPVLLQGETGTGKDLAANYIHQHSSRHDKPFLTIDCTVLSEALFEAEVFGHERGAFTGSVGEKAGLFEVVNGGTLFLDEIGELPAQLQAKLLRVLETGEYRRVGGHKTLYTNARTICATNRNLGTEIASKDFREDLYYRIACLHIEVPALRERLQDVPLLTEALLGGISQATGQRYKLSPDSLMELQSYRFPGNVRELRNILSVAAAHTTDGNLDAKTIIEVVKCMKSRRQQVVYGRRASDTATGGRNAPANLMSAPTETDDAASLENLESRHIAQLLEQHKGNRREVADVLGVSERTIYRKLKRYGLT